jgi:CRISPR-associated protein Cas5h
MVKTLVFDIRGQYAHFKKIYATTSAVSYLIPPKTSLYGYLGAILGLEKDKSEYLQSFENKSCLLGLRIMSPIKMQRININLRPDLNRVSENAKPTMMEFVYQPHYRVYFTHQNETLYAKLKEHLEGKTSVYTPVLGLSSLLSRFDFIGEFDAIQSQPTESVLIDSIIPHKFFKSFDYLKFNNNQVVEQSLYAVEMDSDRYVNERDDVLIDKGARPIAAFVHEFFKIGNENVILF